MIKIATGSLLFVLLLSGQALAERAPKSLGADARVRYVVYSAVDVVRLDTNLRVNTAIELGAGERVNSVLLGDSEAFTVEVLSNRNTISVKPVISGAQSNMTIYTDRRQISFELTEGRSKTPTYRVVMRYSDAKKVVSKVGQTWRDIGYAYSGKSSLRPQMVWNDGSATYFEFRGSTRPSIFGIDGSGYEMTLNSATFGRVVRVSGLRDKYSIRIGKDVVCIEHIADGVTYAPDDVATLADKENSK